MKFLPESYYKHIVGKPPKDLQASDTIEGVYIPLVDGFGSLEDELTTALDPYKKLFNQLESWLDYDLESIEEPSQWSMMPGWNVWDGRLWRPMSAPSGRCMFLDFEAVKTAAMWMPVCAVAITQKGVACWLADFDNLTKTIPYGSDNLLVNYNTPYDRQYLGSEYSLDDKGNRFYDLMSAWIVTHGMTGQQMTVRKKLLKEDGLYQPLWMEGTTQNGLADVWQFFTGHQMSKDTRKDIEQGGLNWVSENLTEVLKYCFRDVLNTIEVFQHLYPIYNLYRSSLVSQAGHIIMGSCKAPMSLDRLPTYYDRAEGAYQEIKKQIADLMWVEANTLLDRVDTNKLTKQQSYNLKWDLAKSGKNKGKPDWWRKVKVKYETGKLGLATREVVTILGLTYKGSEILWSDALGWFTELDGAIPNPEEPDKRLFNLFCTGNRQLYGREIAGFSDRALEALKLLETVGNWVSLRERVRTLRTETTEEGAIVYLPQINPNGTVTGRGADKMLMLAPNPKPNRLGSELKSMVEAPEGWVFVGADVDGEELWLASIFGDSLHGRIGASPLGQAMTEGDKNQGTDVPSLMATQANISRDLAKNKIYGSIYGQGVTGDSQLTLKADRAACIKDPAHKPMDSEVAKGLAKLFIRSFKGSKTAYGYEGGLASEAFNYIESQAEARQPQTALTGALMSKALAGCEDFKPTRINWMVQASGVDFRDYLILLAESFYRKMGVRGFLVIMIHDEIRTCVHQEDAVKASHALQLAHLYTRIAFIDKLKLGNIPSNVAWFSGVDVDRVLRKDPTKDQKTPTQEPLELGYTLTPGQLLKEIAI